MQSSAKTALFDSPSVEGLLLQVDRLTRLQRLTAALSQAVTPEQVADALLSRGMALLSATGGVLYGLSDDGTELIRYCAEGCPEGAVNSGPRLPVGAPVAMANAVREGVPVILKAGANLPRALGPRESAILLPMKAQDRTVGGLGLLFSADRPFPKDEQALLLTVAGLGAVALERSRLYDSARQEADLTVKALRGLLPICAWCKNIRNDQGYWKLLETYLAEHLDVRFTHGMCPPCTRKAHAQARKKPRD